MLPPPKPLDTTGDGFYSWTVRNKVLDLYATATKLREHAKEVQAATFFMEIGVEARRWFYTFKFGNDADKHDIQIYTQKFEDHFKPTTNLTFNEFRFGSRNQQQVEQVEETEQFEVNVVSSLPVADEQLRSIQEETGNDSLMSQLLCYSSTVPDALRPFWAYRDELHVDNGLLLRSNKLVISPAKRPEVLHLLHAAHGREEKMKIRKLYRTTAQSVIQACMEVFATHGIPAKICSDNDPPFTTSKYRSFTSHFHVNHVTSSPHYPRGNGMAECAVQEAKKMLKKFSLGKFEFCSALLEWRNLSRDDLLQSPAERLMGRRTRTRLPVLDCHLEPKTIPTETVRSRLADIRNRQQKCYNKSTRHIPDPDRGSTVSVYGAVQITWAPAVVVGTGDTPRSYIMHAGSGHVRRTRERLRTTIVEIQDPPSETEPPGDTSIQPVMPEDGLRRSTRQRREPQRFPLPECRT
ncbi:uncharacterized protein LOC144098109 [Amblyomma americanum]